MRRETADHLQRAFRKRILPRKFICNCNEVQLISRTFKVFLSSIGVEVQYTAPYCPLENLTERTNQTVMIAQFIEKQQSSWDKMLLEIALAVNTTVANSTDFSPAFLVKGRALRGHTRHLLVLLCPFYICEMLLISEPYIIEIFHHGKLFCSSRFFTELGIYEFYYAP